MKSFKAAFARDGAADNERGSELYLAGDHEGAYEAFKKAIEKNPANAVFYVNRSAANLQLSKLSEAYRDACRALELNNKLARGYVRKGQVLLKKGEPLLAKKTFHEGMKHARNAADVDMLEEGLAQARTAETFLTMAGVAFAAESDEQPQPLPVMKSAPSIMAAPEENIGRQSAECDREETEVEGHKGAESHRRAETQRTMVTSGSGESPLQPRAGRKADSVQLREQEGSATPRKASNPIVHPQVHWSARLLDSLPKPSPVGSGVTGETDKKKGLESMYSPGFLEKHSVNFSSMSTRENWLAMVPEWVKGDGDTHAGLFGHLSHDEQPRADGLEAEIMKRREEEEADESKEKALAVQLGRCIHPIDAETKELVKLDGFFSYEYDNNRLFEHLNRMLMSQEQDLVEAIFSLESERKALARTGFTVDNLPAPAEATVQICLALPQDVTLEGNCLTFRTVMAHMGLLTRIGDEEWSFEAFLGEVHGHLIGTVFNISVGLQENDATSASDGQAPRGREIGEEVKEGVTVGKTAINSVDESRRAQQANREVHILRKRTFRMPGLQEPLLVLLVSDPLWQEPCRPEILPPHGGIVAEGDLPGNLSQRFWFKMRHPAASKLSNSLTRFLAKFVKSPPASPAGKRTSILEFLREFSLGVQACPLWSGVSEDELACAREAAHKRVMSELYSFIFPTVCDPKLDQGTAALVRSLWFLIPEQLNVPSEDLDESILFAAKKELLAMDLFKSPREKVECLLNCCRIIIFQINSKGQVSSADDFLPLLILVVLHGGTAPILHASVAFVNAYCERTEDVAEAFYYLTMLESAVYFVDHLTAKQVRMPQYLFDLYMRGEMPLYRPMTVEKMLSIDGSQPIPRAKTPLLSSTPVMGIAREEEETGNKSATHPPLVSMEAERQEAQVATHSSNRTPSTGHAHGAEESLFDEIEEEEAGGEFVRLSFITDPKTLSVEGLQLEALKDDATLARLVSEYRQLALIVHDLLPSALRF